MLDIDPYPQAPQVKLGQKFHGPLPLRWMRIFGDDFTFILISEISKLPMYEPKCDEHPEYRDHETCHDVERVHMVTPETPRSCNQHSVHDEFGFGQASQQHQQTHHRDCNSPWVEHPRLYPFHQWSIRLSDPS